MRLNDLNSSLMFMFLSMGFWFLDLDFSPRYVEVSHSTFRSELQPTLWGSSHPHMRFGLPAMTFYIRTLQFLDPLFQMFPILALTPQAKDHHTCYACSSQLLHDVWLCSFKFSFYENVHIS